MTEITNFADAISDRIVQYLVDRDVPGRETLTPAAVTAGRILGPFRPLVTTMSKAGLSVGPVAAVRRDALVIVLADPERGLTTLMRVTDGNWGKAAKTTAALGREFAPDDGPWDPAEMMRVAALAVEHSGWIPGDHTEVESEANPTVINSLMMAVLSEATRDSVFGQIANLAKADICPVLVALFGPSTSGDPDSRNSAWPILIPLAPYYAAATTPQSATAISG